MTQTSHASCDQIWYFIPYTKNLSVITRLSHIAGDCFFNTKMDNIVTFVYTTKTSILNVCKHLQCSYLSFVKERTHTPNKVEIIKILDI